MLPFNQQNISVIDDNFRLNKDKTNALSSKIYDIASDLAISRLLVFIKCTNTLSSVSAYLACLDNGHVPLLLDTSIRDVFFQKLVEQYQPNIFVDSEKIYLRDQVVVNNEQQINLHPDLALLLSTSGTTGSPKLVRLSYDNLRSNAVAIADYLKLNSDERPLLHLPIYYSYGLSVLNSHLAVGAKILITNHTVMQRKFWQRLEEEQATSLAGVPYTFEMLERLHFERKSLPYMKTLTQAGGKLSSDLVQKFAQISADRGINFYVMYGQTEASPRISYLQPELALQKPECIGQPIPGGNWWVEDDKGERLPSGQEGELVYQGPNVMMGYAECKEDLFMPDQMGGVLYTGDLAVLDESGMAKIIGRSKRIIKVFGKRVGLDDLEQILSEKGPRAFCLGVEDRLEVIYSCLEKGRWTSAKIGDLLGLNHSAIRVHQVPSIPHKSSGKVDYLKLANEINS